jgi:hypothetical protein
VRQTLPAGTRGWPQGLDVIRKTIRRSPALQKLGEQVGPVKLYSVEELELIRLAVEQRGANRTAAV